MGAGRECEGKHHRKREESLLRRLSPLSLRFSPSRTFRKRNCAVCRRQTCAPSLLILSSLKCAPLSLRVFLGCSCLKRFRRARPPAYAPEKELHALCRSSPFTFPLGAVTNEKPPRGVNCDCGDSPRNWFPEEIGSGHCPPGVPRPACNEIFVSSPIALFGRICYNNRMYSGVCGRIIAACNPRGRKSKKFFGKGCNLF